MTLSADLSARLDGLSQLAGELNTRAEAVAIRLARIEDRLAESGVGITCWLEGVLKDRSDFGWARVDHVWCFAVRSGESVAPLVTESGLARFDAPQFVMPLVGELIRRTGVLLAETSAALRRSEHQEPPR